MLLESLLVTGELGEFFAASSHTSQEFLEEWLAGLCQAVVTPVTILASQDEADLSEVGQVSRSGGLRHFQKINQIADAKLPALK